MAHVNQSAVSSMSLGSYQTRKITWHRIVLLVAAWFEIIVGVSFFLAFNAQSEFLFGTSPEGVVGVTFARFSGIALICLGIACLPSGTSGVRTLLIFNIAVTIFFAWVALTTTFRGVLLWPVVTMHAVIAIALALSLSSPTSFRNYGSRLSRS